MRETRRRFQSLAQCYSILPNESSMTAHSLVLNLDPLVCEKDGSFFKSFLTGLCGRLLFRAETKFFLSFLRAVRVFLPASSIFSKTARGAIQFRSNYVDLPIPKDQTMSFNGGMVERTLISPRSNFDICPRRGPLHSLSEQPTNQQQANP